MPAPQGNMYDPGDGAGIAIRVVNRDGSALSAGGGGGTSATDDGAFTVGVSSLTPVGGIVTADSVDAGDTGAFAMLANRQQKVSLYDSSGVEITSFGGGTQYTEDAAAAANPVGNALIVVRDDARGGSLTTTDGDNVALRGTNAGELYVKHLDALTVSSHAVTNAGTFAVQATVAAGATNIAKAEDVAFADADVGVPSMAVRKATPANTSGTDGDYEMLQMSAGRLWTSSTIDAALPAGTNAIGKLAANSGVDIGDVDVTSLVPGTGATSLGKAEDAAHSSGDTGVMALSVRQDTAAALAGTDADYQPLITDASGRLHVNVGNTVTVGSHAVTNAGTFAVQESGAALTSLQLIDDAVYAEDVASQAADKGLAILAVRRDADTSMVGTDGDYANLQVNAAGSLKVAITAGAGSGGTSLADNAGFTPGTTSFTPIGGEVDDTGTSAASENSGAAVRITAQRAFHVNLRDNSGNEVSVGGGTQYDEDAASAGAEKLTLAGAVRRDTAASSSGTDGDYSTLNTDASGRLWVNASGAAVPVTDNAGSLTVDNAGTFAVQATLAAGATTVAKAEDVASADADVGIPAMAVRKATPANTSGTDGDYEMLQMSAGRLWVDPSGVTLTVASHAVTNAGTFAVQADSVIPGSGATNLGKAEDAAHTTGDVGVMALSVRQNTAAATSGADGDYQPLITDTNGRLHVLDANSASALTALQLIDDPVIADDTAFTPATSKVMMAGFEADESSTDSVDEGDAGAARMTLDRKIITTLQPHTAGGLSTFMASGSDGSSILVATAQVVKASAGQLYGYYIYNPEAAVTFVHFYNTAAASVTVGTTNPLFTIAVPAGAAANLTIPQGITFSNAGWSCAATTTAGGNTAPATGASLVAWYM